MASSDVFYQEWVDEVRELYGLLEDALIAMNNATRSPFLIYNGTLIHPFFSNNIFIIWL